MEIKAMFTEFKNKKANINKLLSFGFEKKKEGFVYSSSLLDGQMQINITVFKDGKINTEVIDETTNEEYILHLVQGASGSFVGKVKKEYEAILEQISSECFDTEVFKSSQAKKLISYVKEKYGDEPEYLWQKFPDNAVVRRKDNKKWYLALLTVSRRKLGLDSDEIAEILDLRMTTENIEALVDNKKYYPGYHMNKKHWITICLDETLSFDEISCRIDESYKLALK